MPPSLFLCGSRGEGGGIFLVFKGPGGGIAELLAEIALQYKDLNACHKR